ncbi:hypothetical protein [Bdellovibrio bacteriovorus]|uniref:hypothetical protein n=1 Tax=Bdellovibrio bacteriovorus TaxID=959 RepID=UPI0035A85BBD
MKNFKIISFIAFVIFGFRAVTAFSDPDPALEPPQILAQSFQYDSQADTIQKMVLGDVNTVLQNNWDWASNALELKLNGASTIRVSATQDKKFTVTVDKAYPATLGKPVVQLDQSRLKVTFPRWNVFANGNAQISVRMISQDGSKSSAWVQSAYPLMPFANYHDEVNLPKALEASGVKALDAWLSLLMTKVFSSAPKDVLYSMGVAYEFPLETGGPNVVNSILYVSPKAYLAGDAKEIADTVATALRQGGMIRNGSSLIFTIEVFRNSEKPTPLLQIQQLVLPSIQVDLN